MVSLMHAAVGGSAANSKVTPRAMVEMAWAC
jgi:hypothetical protein